MSLDERMQELVKEIERWMKKTGVTVENEDEILDKHEAKLEEFDKKIKKTIERVWEETNYEYAKREWRIAYESSPYEFIIRYLN
jgi:ElaB/YqjD/DUF883 family membrane-anchored ribosome-binding protein